ncbi:MAG TPA: amino acid adenylation domain-containing protein, partial [Thermoanaerobaculia bacterium]
MASDPATLIERLRSRALLAPGRRVYTFLADGEEEQGRLTFAELDERARAIAAELRRRCRPGDRALLLYPPGLDFAAAFFGCLYAGLVAVPAYPPRSPRALPRLRSILEDSSPALALAPAASAARIRGWFARHPDLPSIPWLATDEVPLAMAEEWRDPGVRGDDLAFLQYTSGSTSAPKGVMVSHGNLVHNQRVIEGACRHGEESVFVSWLPVYHDLGLIGQVLQAVWTGAHCVLMAPVAFLQHPPRWLRAVSRYRATTSGGPNFAYELCLRKVAAEGLDLSSWQVAFNGAEPVRASTLERFAEAFAPAGFRREALYPCYGLAETTLMVSGGRPEVAPAVHAFDPEALAAGRIAAAGDGGAGRPLVGCGGILSDLEAVIADPETGAACRPGRIGEIWVAGGSVARGYWNRPEETERIFGARLPDGRGPFLRTGDLGFLHEGELFITGRIKDLIILRGRNLYPQDVELAAERSHPALRTGGGAAFSVEATGEERLVIVHEVERHAADREGSAEEIAAAVRQAVAEEHEAAVHEVVLVVPGGVPKTTSGKVQRRACRDLYLRGELDAVGRSRLAPAAAEEPAIAGDALGETLAATPEAERPALVESWLRRTFARLAGTGAAAIDPEAPLTALGLDSLVAIELKNAVEAETGAELSIVALLEGMSLREAARNLTLLAPLGPLEILPTVETPRGASPAAAFISRNPRDAADTSGGGDAPRGVSTVGDAADRSVLSWGQRSLWFLHRLAPDSPAYNIAGAARLAGPFDREALLRALAALADRHPALRTTYAAGAEGPVQRAGERPADAVRRVDASGWSDEEVRAGLHEEAFRPIDLERGPVFRAALFERGEEAWLVLAVHHVAADLWSLAVMTRELGAFYAGAELPEPEARYADFVAWEERRLAGERGERLWSFWRERLAGAPPLDLPTDRPRPPVQTFRGGARSLRLPAADLEAIRNLAAVRGVTLFMALTAGFQALLSRYSGQEDFLVGTPTSGRGSERWAGVVGYFVNTVALRAGLAGDPEADELLERVRRTALDMFEHQDFPFALLAERLQPDRDPSRPHLIQAQLGLEKAPSAELAALPAFALQQGGATLSLGGLELESVALDTPASQMDLTLLAAELEGGLSLWLQHNADLFDAATAERMLGHLGNLLRGMAADPRRRISGIEILSPAERRQIVEEWAGAASDYPRDQPVHALFEEQARRTPGKVALVFQDEETTYAELNARANQLARHLRALGVVPETPIGVALDRSPDLIASFLGILKAGGAYVPLDPAYPRERLAMMTEEVALPFLVTNGEETSRWDVSTGMRIVDLDREREAIAAGSAADPDWPVCGARGLAYVMFTSGSTGRPKAVGVEHRSIVRLVRGAGYTDFGPDQTFLQLAPNSFDAATFEIWGPLLNGGRLALFPGRVPSFAELGEVMARHGVTLLWITTGLFHQVVENRFEILRIPRIIMTGGEVTSPEHVNRVLREIPGARLLHCYGPTENTTFTTCQTLKEPVPQGSTVPIGQAIPNSRIYLVDRSFRPVPVGVPGELVTGGDGLARGYLNRPDLTAEKFVPDPLSGEPGARLYRSGDLIRWRPDGNIEFLARVDQQVKIRGFRVEPGEVEIALARHPAVRAAAVVVAGRGSAGRRLVAYVGADGERAGLASILRAWLRERLPEPMMPAAFVILPELPLNPNGKVDRQALPDPESLEVESETPYEAPRNPAEELIAGIWEEVLGVLGVGRVGVRDDFFALGGHSLLATRVLARLREPFGVEPPVSALFADPTVAGLAAAVEAARRAGASGPEPPPFRRVPRDGSTPLSFAQERLWFLDRLTPGLPVYNVPAGVRLRGDLDADALARALSEAVRRHEALRTVFSEGPTGPVQTVQPAELALAVSDLSSLPDPEEAALRTAVEEAGTPFDLGAAPLLRALLLRIGPRDHLLVLTLHHIASDGWSMTVLFRELEALYAAFRDGRPSPLPELAFQYADFTVWQRAWLAGALEDQLAGWRAALAGAPESLDLPTDRPRPPVQRFRGLSVPVSLSAETARGLRSLARQEGATLFMALLAGFSALLARYSHQEDLVVGSPVANRNRPEIEPLIGFFVNTLPMRARLDGEPSFRELTARVRDAALAAYARQDVPFERLVEAVGARRDLSRSPLFQVMLAVEESPARAPRLAGLEAEPVAIHNGTAKFEITLHLSSSGDGLAGGMEVDSDLFDAATAERMLGHLASLLAAAAADPAAGVRELPLLGESESRQLLEWGGGPGDDTAGSPVFLLHERFAWQAARSPEAPAVVFEGERLSYGELDRRATRLAQTLRAWGVGPGELVALCLERSLEMVVAVLGVLKAGATYVPIDPDYPAERIGFLLADSAAPVLLSQRTVAAGLPEHGCRTLLLDDGWEAQAPAAGEALPAVPPESPAYVIYTSGSTGRPKGVVVSHAHVARLFSSTEAWFGFGPEDVWTLFHSYAFDFSVWEIWGALLYGGRLVVVPYWVSRSPEAFHELLRQEQVTVLNQTPSAFRQLLRADETAPAG